jgi:hypothetical protein
MNRAYERRNETVFKRDLSEYAIPASNVFGYPFGSKHNLSGGFAP